MNIKRIAATTVASSILLVALASPSLACQRKWCVADAPTSTVVLEQPQDRRLR